MKPWTKLEVILKIEDRMKKKSIRQDIQLIIFYTIFRLKNALTDIFIGNFIELKNIISNSESILKKTKNHTNYILLLRK